ncbi:hypothetical protein V8C42DRAFT_353465 [Trichoderma barbatum]
MTIHEDARNEILVGDVLDNYVKNNPDILNEQSPDLGMTPLAIAAIEWHPEGLVLQKMPPESVDDTCKVAGFTTPLMYAVENKDLESIRLLRKAKASVDTKSEQELTAREMAKYTGEPAVSLALDLDEEKAAKGMIASKVVELLLYMVEWVNKTIKGVLFMIMNEGDVPDKEEFVANTGQYLENRQLLERFFKGKKTFVQKLSQKIASLEEDSTTRLDNNDLFTSMKREERWESQKELIQRIAQVTTLILPEGEGVTLRFINRDVDNSTNLALEGIENILQPMTWQPGGDTPIGTNLRSKILQPLVYSKIEDKALEKSLPIIILTDGMPEPEDSSIAKTVCNRMEEK